jgi:hypothetical protein
MVDISKISEAPAASIFRVKRNPTVDETDVDIGRGSPKKISMIKNIT